VLLVAMLKLEVLVEVDGRETVCAMELPETTTVGEANEAVRERCGTGDGTWSLYSHDLGRFLHRKLSLLSQQVTGGGSLEYKAATQVARVHMWDGSVTSVLLDLTRGASDVVCILCDKMGVAATGRHEYALRLQEPNGVRRRLRPDEALLEQGVDQFRELAFGKAFSTPQELDDLESAFGLCCEGFLEGNWPTGEAEVLALAALLVQVQHGDYARFKVRKEQRFELFVTLSIAAGGSGHVFAYSVAHSAKCNRRACVFALLEVLSGRVERGAGQSSARHCEHDCAMRV
jgi:hypothetical protein